MGQVLFLDGLDGPDGLDGLDGLDGFARRVTNSPGTLRVLDFPRFRSVPCLCRMLCCGVLLSTSGQEASNHIHFAEYCFLNRIRCILSRGHASPSIVGSFVLALPSPAGRGSSFISTCDAIL